MWKFKLFKTKCKKDCHIHTCTIEHIKLEYLTCNISAISSWIFMQQKGTEVLSKDLSSDTE